MQTFKQYLQSNLKNTYGTYQAVEKSDNQMFLIRSQHVNNYELLIKKQMESMNV